MLIVSLVTLGSPEQLTGGYLYHRRMADLAPEHDARIEFVSATALRDPFAAAGDVVLVDSIAAATVAPWLLRRRLRRGRGAAPRPLAAILHQPPGGIDHGRVRQVVQARLDRSLYRGCGLLVVASSDLRDTLVESHGLPAGRMCVVAPGRDVAPAPAVRRDLRDGRRAAFLSVGNWVERKGTLELLDAFARLEPELATLHLVGRDDIEPEYTQHVRGRLAEPVLAGRVVVHGPVARGEVAALYASADAFVLPSLREPYGTVYGEAMAFGLPVVGWRAGNLPHLAQDGVSGVVLESGDVAGLASALRRLATDEGWRHELGDGARRRAQDFPTWDDSAALLFGELRSLVRRDG